MKHSLFYLLLLTWLCVGSACKNEEKVYDKETIEAAITSLQGIYEGELRLFEPSGFKGNITLQSQIVTADRVLQLSVPIDSLFVFFRTCTPQPGSTIAQRNDHEYLCSLCRVSPNRRPPQAICTCPSNFHHTFPRRFKREAYVRTPLLQGVWGQCRRRVHGVQRPHRAHGV